MLVLFVCIRLIRGRIGLHLTPARAGREALEVVRARSLRRGEEARRCCRGHVVGVVDSSWGLVGLAVLSLMAGGFLREFGGRGGENGATSVAVVLFGACQG